MNSAELREYHKPPEGAKAIPSPTTRLTKSYANQNKNGKHMVDLIDAANGNVIARCIYEPYANEILEALRKQHSA